MASKALQKARDYLRQRLPELPTELLPVFHLTGGTGWINDPNGFSVYRGEYHLFYQYYPYDVRWGPMHWGHARTRDFLHWEPLPPALAPDMPYDRDGCFSGSAVETPDGRHLLMYTGVRNIGGPADCVQTQCIAWGDGLDYEKDPGNPVLDAAALPPGGSARDFRDPKIWREGDRYLAVVGNRPADGSGAILLYESPDALRWTYAGTLAECRNEYGKMWECPDYFSLDGTEVLLTSPQEMLADAPEFHNGGGTLCLLGHWDAAERRLVPEARQAIDYGFDFYATQTLQTPDGRRVMIAWMQSWETSAFRPKELPFCGQMCLPRELRVRNGRLCQTPVRELEALRRNAVFHRNVTLKAGTAQSLPGVRGRTLDLLVTLRAGDGQLRIDLAADSRRRTSLICPAGRDTLVLDRTDSGFPYDIPTVRSIPIGPSSGELSLRIVLDRWSLEVFVNGGAQAASSVLYTPQEAQEIRFSAEGADAVLDVEKYDIVL